MREKFIEQALVKAVGKRGGICEKWIAGTAGWPDRIVILPGGRIAFVEVKAPRRKPRAIQAHRHEQLRALGQKVYVLDDMERIKGILDDIERGCEG